MYWKLHMAGGQVITVFQDLMEPGHWYLQTDSRPVVQPEPLSVLAPRVVVADDAADRQESAS